MNTHPSLRPRPMSLARVAMTAGGLLLLACGSRPLPDSPDGGPGKPRSVAAPAADPPSPPSAHVAASTAPPDDAGPAAPTALLAFGKRCQRNAQCESGACVFPGEIAYGTCTRSCATSAECPDGWNCRNFTHDKSLHCWPH